MTPTKKSENFQENVEEQIDIMKKKAEEYQHHLTAYIQKKPFTALAIAAGAGLLIGAGWTALRHRK
ncbi:MAG: hypothetical protein HGA76_05920 [Candidatus Firestonebacteria bacterium]|nr:hypothetical protein [Candidatus Firestonebacteria bacterium]